MRILIDGDACTGHGRCYSLVPQLFESDEMGHSFALIEVVGDGDEAAARSAMLNCPEQAISLIDD